MQTIGLILVVISFVPIIISIKFKRNFFNVKEVIIDHLKLFKNCKSQYFVFYGSPLLLSVGLALIYNSTKAFYDNLSLIVSIILSMLFAVLAIITNYDYSHYKDKKKTKIQNVVTETINSIIFETFICVLILLYGMIILIIDDSIESNMIANKVVTGFAIFLFTVLLFDLLIVIKRISKIMLLKTTEGDQET